jgi:hypothetical protein
MYLSAMKRVLLTLSYVFIASLSMLAQTMELRPTIPMGEMSYQRITWSEELQKEGFVKEEPVIDTLSWTVTALTSDYMDLLYRTPNPVYPKINALLEKPYQNDSLAYIDAQCRLTFTDGILSLENWQEIQRIHIPDFGQAKEAIKSSDNTMGQHIPFIIDPYIEMLQTKEGIESLLLADIQILLKPYGKTYTQGDTLRYTDTHENPLKPGNNLSTTESFTWIKDSTHPIIEYRIDFDVSALKQMMIDMVIKMSEAFNSTDEKMKEKIKEAESIEMNLNNLFRFEYNPVTLNLQSLQQVMTFDGHDGRKKRASRKYQTYTQIVNP